MSLEDRIVALQQKHEALEAAIEEMTSHPHPDDIHIHDLKKQKLRIKDELARLGMH